MDTLPRWGIQSGNLNMTSTMLSTNRFDSTFRSFYILYSQSSGFVVGNVPPDQAYGPTRVILLSQYMFPESNATGDLMTSLAMGLAASDFVVTAYCAQPSYFG